MDNSKFGLARGNSARGGEPQGGNIALSRGADPKPDGDQRLRFIQNRPVRSCGQAKPSPATANPGARSARLDHCRIHSRQAEGAFQ